MPNNNQSEEVERIVEEFIRDFTEPHPEGRTMYGRHTQPTERLIEVYRQTLTTHGASEYARGRSEALKQILCRHDIDGDVCDCCRTNYERIDDLI